MKRYLLTLVLLCCFAGVVSGRKYALLSYNVDNGLSSNTVRCITQDHRGFMWFGTADGLNRFDGVEFRVYNSENQTEHGLGSTNIHALCVDKKNRLWVGTELGIYRYDEKSSLFTRFETRTQYGVVITSRITKIVENRDGKIWIGTEAQGFFVYHPEDNTLEQNSRYPDVITEITPGPDWNMFVGVRNGVISEFDSEGRSLYFRRSEIPQPGRPAGILSLCYYNDQLWSCLEGAGLAKIEWTGDRAIQSVDRDISARALLLLERGEVLVGGDNGLYLLYAATGKIEPITDMSPTENPYIHTVNAIFRDMEGGIWVATQHNGVDYLPRRLKPIGHMPRYLGEDGRRLVTSFAEDPRHNVWLGIDNRGVVCLTSDGREGASPFRGLSPQSQQELRNVKTLLVANGRLWAGTLSGGVYSCELPSGAVRNYRNDPASSMSLNDNNIEKLFVDGKGDVYAATPWGFARFDEKEDRFIRIKKGGNDLSVCDFAKADKDSFWLLSPTKGAFLYNTATQDFKHHAYAGRPNPVGNCIFVDSRGDTWLGTEAGLFKLDREKGRFRSIPILPDTLRGVTIVSQEEDYDGRLWLGTNNGLFCMDPETNEVLYHLTVSDGLPANQFCNRACFLSQDGRLFFSGINGYATLRPEELQRNGFIPPVYITGLYLNDKKMDLPRIHGSDSPLTLPVHLSKKLRLRYDQNSVGFTIASLSYQSPGKNKYAYRLEGFDENWRYSDGNDIRYSNLSPGKYRFRVKGSNEDGVWSGNEAVLSFVVSPPFYRSGGAIVLYILLAATGGWLSGRYIRYRHRKKLKEFAQEQEKINYKSKIDFFTNVAHEIRTPLSLIKVPLESVLGSGEKFSSRTQEYLGIMDKNAGSLLEMTNQLLDLRKTEQADYAPQRDYCSVSKLIEEACVRFMPAAEVSGLTIRRMIEPDVVAFVDSQAMGKIINNLLSNALKYANHTIEVTLESADEMFRIMVADDGKGISGEDKERVFDAFYQSENSKGGTGIGLPLARLLAVKHGGSLRCEESGLGGALFTVEIPTNEVALSQKTDSALHQDPLPAGDDDLVEEKEDEGSCVMVVEDNDQLRGVIAELVGMKYRVVTAVNGRDAVEKLALHDCDVIVSDIMMPEMDGYELCEYVKTEMKYCHIPIIQLTAKTSIEDKVKGLEFGADAYIEKPFSSEHLMAQISSLLINRERIRRALTSVNSNTAPDTHSLGVGKRDAEFIEKLNDLIEEHLCEENFYVEQLAEKMYMSRSNFYRKVKNLFGVSPNGYMKNYRLRKAAEMIRSDDYMIKEIYEQVGFRTSSYFSACFREEFGVTPKQYKEQHSKPKQ